MSTRQQRTTLADPLDSKFRNRRFYLITCGETPFPIHCGPGSCTHASPGVGEYGSANQVKSYSSFSRCCRHNLLSRTEAADRRLAVVLLHQSLFRGCTLPCDTGWYHSKLLARALAEYRTLCSRNRKHCAGAANPNCAGCCRNDSSQTPGMEVGKATPAVLIGGVICTGIIIVLGSVFFSPDQTAFDWIALISLVIWPGYFFASTRVKRVFFSKDRSADVSPMSSNRAPVANGTSLTISAKPVGVGAGVSKRLIPLILIRIAVAKTFVSSDVVAGGVF